MKTIIISYFSSLVSLLFLDGIWLSTMAKRFYAVRLSELMAGSFKLLPAIIFYLLYALGVTIFVVLPALQNNYSFFKVFLLGAFLGLIAYAAYDLTNQATLKNWPLVVTVVDLLWGSLLAGLASLITFFIMRMVK